MESMCNKECPEHNTSRGMEWVQTQHSNFGCIAYAQVLEANRKKLDDRGEKCIFVGYSGESKAYISSTHNKEISTTN